MEKMLIFILVQRKFKLSFVWKKVINYVFIYTVMWDVNPVFIAANFLNTYEVKKILDCVLGQPYWSNSLVTNKKKLFAGWFCTEECNKSISIVD